MKRLMLVVLFLIASMAEAGAEPYTSTEYGFTVDFPNPPQVTTPSPSEKDSAGNVLSNFLMFDGGLRGAYVASVAVDTFVKPYTVDVSGSLARERDNYIKAFGATLLDSHAGTLDGQQAMFFNYEKTDHTSLGRAVVIVIPSEKPRVYIAIVAYPGNAAQDELDLLNRFLDSFHVTP